MKDDDQSVTFSRSIFSKLKKFFKKSLIPKRFLELSVEYVDSLNVLKYVHNCYNAEFLPRRFAGVGLKLKKTLGIS